MRIMALDIGDRRIGIAMSDALRLTIQGRPTLTRSSLPADLDGIRRLVEQNDVGEIVVGDPLHMSGQPSPQCEKVRAFVAGLQQVVSVPVRLWDERLSSREAEEMLKSQGLDWKARRRRLDEFSALVILRSYLDSQP